MGEMEEKRVENVDGEPRLATLGRECTHISHNFPRKFPGKLRAGIVQLKFIFEHPGSGFHICVRNSFRFCSLSLLLLSFRWLCFCSALVLHSSFRRLHRPRLER